MTIPTETSFLGLDRERPWITYLWLVSLGEALICTDLKVKSRLAWFEDLDTTMSHVGCEMLWSLDPTDKYV